MKNEMHIFIYTSGVLFYELNSIFIVFLDKKKTSHITFTKISSKDNLKA